MISMSVLSELLNIDRRSISKLINDKKDLLESYGCVTTERHEPMRKRGGANKVEYLLNERQAIFLIMTARTSDYLKLKALQAIEGGGLIEAISSIDFDFDVSDKYVYLIEDIESGKKKIGVSSNPEKRLKQLQAASSNKLDLVFYVKAESAYRLESDLHKRFTESRLHGEWFGSDLNNLEVMNYAKSY